VKFDFVIISLKNHNLPKLRNFSSPKLKIKGHWRRRAPSAWRFLKFFSKIMHFRHISAKIKLKNLKQRFDWGGGTLATPLVSVLKSVFERLQSVLIRLQGASRAICPNLLRAPPCYSDAQMKCARINIAHFSYYSFKIFFAVNYSRFENVFG